MTMGPMQLWARYSPITIDDFYQLDSLDGNYQKFWVGSSSIAGRSII